MLYVDIPTSADLADLSGVREDICVSIYLGTTPLSQDAGADRIELKNLSKEAIAQLESAGADKRRVAAVAEHIDDLTDDDEFWRFQARSLGILVTPDNMRTFRLPNALQPMTAVSDRFHLKPLLRATTFPNAAYLLALSENAVRLVEVLAELPPAEVKVDGLPKDAASAVGKSTLNDRSPSGRITGTEGQNVRLRQFARKVDQALRPLLSGGALPLVLASDSRLASIYRSVNSYPELAPDVIDGSPDRVTDANLAESARGVLDALYAAQIAEWVELFEARDSQGRVATDLGDAARAATFGAVDSILVDIDEAIPGAIDDKGTLTLADKASADSYDVVDEIARRVIGAGGRVYAVRKDDIPRGKPLAAILRYAV